MQLLSTFDPASALIGGSVALVLVLAILWPWIERQRRSDAWAAPGPSRGPVDPWMMQDELMRISGQEMPGSPVVSKGSVMYAALLLEEAAETMVPLRRVLGMLAVGWPALSPLAESLEEARVSMAFNSHRVRETLAELPDFKFAMKHSDAVELLDGVTDTVVVTCGLATASGLPGAEAYLEVGTSNHSKKNPLTGVIDKTPDGKWIKGPAFRKPDLRAVLGRAPS